MVIIKSSDMLLDVFESWEGIDVYVRMDGNKEWKKKRDSWLFLISQCIVRNNQHYLFFIEYSSMVMNRRMRGLYELYDRLKNRNIILILRITRQFTRFDYSQQNSASIDHTQHKILKQQLHKTHAFFSKLISFQSVISINCTCHSCASTCAQWSTEGSLLSTQRTHTSKTSIWFVEFWRTLNSITRIIVLVNRLDNKE